jgi:hypothetical protein
VDGKKLRIRPAEELYLYERLVLRKRPKEATCRYAIQRLRERHGADFLAEAVCHSPSGGIEGSVRREGFERALRKYMEKDGRTAYEEQGYRFDFLNGRYTWNGDELRITPKEAVFLYERAVLRLRNSREQRRCTEANTLYHMRKKFGSVFLNEIFPVRRHRQWY